MKKTETGISGTSGEYLPGDEERKEGTEKVEYDIMQLRRDVQLNYEERRKLKLKLKVDDILKKFEDKDLLNWLIRELDIKDIRQMTPRDILDYLSYNQSKRKHLREVREMIDKLDI